MPIDVRVRLGRVGADIEGKVGSSMMRLELDPITRVGVAAIVQNSLRGGFE